MPAARAGSLRAPLRVPAAAAHAPGAPSPLRDGTSRAVGAMASPGPVASFARVASRRAALLRAVHGRLDRRFRGRGGARPPRSSPRPGLLRSQVGHAALAWIGACVRVKAGAGGKIDFDLAAKGVQPGRVAAPAIT